jgi:FdhE protein
VEAKWLSEAEAVFDRISRAQEEAADGFSPDLPDRGDRRESGGPLITREEIPVDRARFEHLLAETLDILEDWLGGGAIWEGARDGGNQPLLSDYDRSELLAAAIEGGGALERRAEELAARPEPFACAVRYAFAPFLKACARELKDGFDPESVLGGRCPVCGAEPFIAEFDGEDGRRRLACGLCGTRWRFARVKCPFCGNDDHRKLGFLEVEGPRDLTGGYRVDVCEACKRYVKTVDRRTLTKPVTLELADVLTPELDEAAIERGYGLCETTGRI